MKTKSKSKLLLLGLLLLLLSALNSELSILFAQGTTFTYQGQLNAGGIPANGTYDFAFALYNDPVAGSEQATAITNRIVGVTNSLFTTTLDFGSAPWTGQLLWMQVSVRTNGAAALTVLSPRQPMYPAPYAIMAASASNLLGNLPAGKLSGTYNGIVTLNSFSNSFNGTFSGNGSALSSVNAATLAGLSAGSFWQLGGNTVSPGQFLGCNNNQPLEIHASAGVAINTNSPAATLHISGNQFVETLDGSSAAGTWLNLNNFSGGHQWSLISSGSANGEGAGKLLFFTSGLTRMIIDASGNVSATAFNPTSDRNAKDHFRPVDPCAVLEKVAALPISEWNYKSDEPTHHIGPMAQDFYSAFQVGTDDRHIATVDADGVALAAIQGLNEKVEHRTQKSEDRIQKLEAENAELKQRLNALEKIISQPKIELKGDRP